MALFLFLHRTNVRRKPGKPVIGRERPSPRSRRCRPHPQRRVGKYRRSDRKGFPPPPPPPCWRAPSESARCAFLRPNAGSPAPRASPSPHGRGCHAPGNAVGEGGTPPTLPHLPAPWPRQRERTRSVRRLWLAPFKITYITTRAERAGEPRTTITRDIAGRDTPIQNMSHLMARLSSQHKPTGQNSGANGRTRVDRLAQSSILQAS